MQNKVLWFENIKVFTFVKMAVDRLQNEMFLNIVSEFLILSTLLSC